MSNTMMLDTPEQQLPYFHKSRDRWGLSRTSACPPRSGRIASYALGFACIEGFCGILAMRPALLSQPGRDIIRPMMGIMAMGCITEALGFTRHAVIEAGDASAGRRIWPGRARLPSCR